MTSFVACYIIVWVAVTAYVAHLGATQAQLRRKLDDLQRSVDQKDTERSHVRRAA